MAPSDGNGDLLGRWLKATAGMTAYAAAQAAGISEESARRFRKGERPTLSYKVRDALAKHLAQLEPRPALAPVAASPSDPIAAKRREAVADLLRVYRLRLWESAGQFALDVFDAAVEQQRAEVARALGEVPPHPSQGLAGVTDEQRLSGTEMTDPATEVPTTSPVRKRRVR